MSRATMFVIRPDGSLSQVTEYRNAWGFAPLIWDAICERYLGNRHEWLTGKDRGANLWPLWKEERLPVHWRVALACTFDYAIVSRDSRKEVADHLRHFSTDTWRAGYCDHLPQIAKDLLYTLEQKAIGCCFQGTSVSENPWRTYDEAADKMVDYDFDTRTDHFFVMESINAPAQPL